MSRHAVVIGGAGFVGSHLVDRLLADGLRVTSIDNYGSGRHRNLAHLADETRFEERKHDIRDSLPAFESVDQIYHLASRASPTDFEEYALEIALTNSIGTQRVFQFAGEYDATVVFASTSEVYGDPEIHPQSENYHGSVNIRGTRAPYDESKRFAEALGTAHARQNGLDVRTVRIFNTYGPRMREDDGRVIPTFVSQVLRGEELTVHGTGEQTRSFCYVSDLVDGLRRIAEAPAERVSNEVFNLGNTNEITINTLAKTILEISETDSGIVYTSRPKDDPEVRQPDISRAKATIGWTPDIDLRTGLRRTVDYFDEVLVDTIVS